MEREQARLIDGIMTLESGVFEGKSPSSIGSMDPFGGRRVARMFNATVREDYPETRPPFKKLKLFFQNDSDRSWFETHNVQGRFIYETPQATFHILSVGGRIYRINPRIQNAVNVMDISIPGDPNPSVRPHVWMCQAERWLIIQDGQSIPLIYDGSTMRRSKIGPPLMEVPVGCMMTYGLGRLVVVLPHRRAYVIGDIVNGGTTVLQFTEDTYLNEGGNVTVPVQGKITGVAIVAQLDQSVGQGDLMVHTRKGVASARIGEPRDTWKEIKFQPTVLIGSGATSQNSISLVNGDMLFRGVDGIRSLAMSRREFQTSWSMTPLSREVALTLSYDTEFLLDFAESALFDNRLLMTVNQTPLPNGCYHRGLVALDFDKVSGMAEKLPPAYDGVWTGLHITSIVAGEFDGVSRCFLTHRNSNNENEVWELLKDGYLDNDRNRIEMVIESAALLRFGSGPKSLKQLQDGDISLERMVGQVDWSVQWKPDQAPCWYDWVSGSACAATRDCADGSCDVTTYNPQYRTKKRFGQPPDEMSISDNKPARMGFEYQVRLVITGKATLNALRISAIETEEPLGEVDGLEGE